MSISAKPFHFSKYHLKKRILHYIVHISFKCIMFKTPAAKITTGIVELTSIQ